MKLTLMYKMRRQAVDKLFKITQVSIRIHKQTWFDIDNHVSDIKLVYDRYSSLKIFSVKILSVTLCL